MYEGQEGGRRKAPYAFTEQGIYMLATVLRGELAEQQSIFIMRAFREMRHYIKKISSLSLSQLLFLQSSMDYTLLLLILVARI